MATTNGVRIRSLESIGERELAGLCEVLVDCVEGGDSVSFMFPMSVAKAEAFWRAAGASLARGERAVLVVYDVECAILCTATVLWTQPKNQTHSTDVSKMLVHRRARRRGVGGRLLAAAEAHAARAGRTLLVLDTASADAERLYERASWKRCGVIPDYALMPDGRPCATIVFYKSVAT